MDTLFLVIDPSTTDGDDTEALLRRVSPRARFLRSESGEGGLEALAEARTVPSMVFVPFEMPDMNAIDFLRRLREQRWLDGTPVALLSSLVSDRVVVQCYRLGASVFLAKPVQLHELREAIREHGRTAYRLNATGFMPRTATPAHETDAA